MRLHHVGFVVDGIAGQMKAFVHSLGAHWDGNIYEDPRQRVRVAFLTTRPGEAQIELVEPAGPESPVRRFLEHKGGGLHHLCYEVDDLEEGMAELKAKGAMMVSRPKPAVAFDGRRISWMLTAEKLLLELLERQAG